MFAVQPSLRGTTWPPSTCPRPHPRLHVELSSALVRAADTLAILLVARVMGAGRTESYLCKELNKQFLKRTLLYNIWASTPVEDIVPFYTILLCLLRNCLI